MHTIRRRFGIISASLTLFALLAVAAAITGGLAIAAWSNDPAANNPVGTVAGDESYTHAITDADGNVFIGWQRYLTSGNEEVRVQKLDGSGNILWAANGVAATPNLSGVYENFALASDSGGGVYVAFRTPYMDLNGDGDVGDAGEYFGAYRIYVQRVDTDGNVLWAAPERVVTYEHDLYGPAAVSDGQGGVIVSWVGDYPKWHVFRDPTVTSVAVQRFDGEGNRLWGDDGSLIFEPWNEVSDNVSGTVSGVTSPVGLAEDGAGGAFVAWDYLPNGHPGAGSTSELHVMRINADGDRLVGAYNSVGANAGEIYTSNPGDFKMLPDGLGGAVMAWQGYDGTNGGTSFDIYAQRVDHDADIVWQAGGLPISVVAGGQGAVIGAVPPGVDIASDGAGGAFIVWEDGRPSNTYSTPFAQMVDAAGNVQWAANGIQVPLTAPFTVGAPRVVPDGEGGAMFAWILTAGSYPIYAQRLDSAGARVWASDLGVSTANAGKNWPVMVSPSAGGAVAAWYDYRNQVTNGADIYAQGFNKTGVLGAVAAEPTPTQQPTATLTPTPTATVAPTATLAPTQTSTPVLTPTPTAVPEPVPGISGPGMGVMVLLLAGLVWAAWRFTRLPGTTSR